MEKISMALITSILLIPFSVVRGASIASRLQRINLHDGYRNGYSRDDFYDEDRALRRQAAHEAGAHEVAKTFVNFLEREGFDFQNHDDMKMLASFLETVTAGEVAPQSKASRFLNMLKKGGASLLKSTKEYAQKHAKGAIKEAVKFMITAFLQKGLPVFEEAYENAMQKIPIDVRITYAPMAYNLWQQLFEKFKIELPEGFGPERFVCKAMTKAQCDGILRRIKSQEEEEISYEKGRLRGMEEAAEDEVDGSDDNITEEDMSIFEF
uniref:Uncharacterized protein n=1 Tax=Babesia bovis TaxID=5865 RepID=S6BL81_BABBO|nr:hypothetical protein [Babesia bovis]